MSELCGIDYGREIRPAVFNDDLDVSPIPYCSREECPQYDGERRCRLLGARPGNICEPAVAALLREIERLRAAEEPLP